MSELKDRVMIIYLGIAGIIGIMCVGVVALFLIFSPRSIQNAGIPIVGALAAMGAALGYFAGKKL